MKTLIFIHGGESFIDEESYLKFLSNTYAKYYITPWEDREKIDYRTHISRRWIGDGGQVYYPTMPNKLNARYKEWKIVFEGILEKLTSEDEVTLVGGSLGGCFLLKYFSEQNQESSPFVISSEAEKSLLKSSYEYERDAFSKAQEKEMPTAGQKRIQINQIHLLAACISEGDFTTPDNYEFLQKLGNQVHIWHAKDDNVVPFATAEELIQTLPHAQTHFFSPAKGYGHFHGVDRIPELEESLFSK